jgi:hypothetical protein
LGLVNYLKLDSISIVGWSDGGCWMEMGISGKSKKRRSLQWAYLRPDSTAVNSWAVKNVIQKRLMKQKLKKDTNRNGNYKNFSDFG